MENAEQIIGNIREAVLDMLKGLHVLNYRGYGNERQKILKKISSRQPAAFSVKTK